MTKCREIFEQFLDIHNEECLREVEAVARVRQYRRKDYFIRAGEKQSELPFLYSGSVRGYFVDDAGKSHCDCIEASFGYPVTASTEIERLLQPSDIYIEAMEDSEAVCIPMTTIIHIIMTYPEVAEAVNRIVRIAFDHHRQMQLMLSYPLKQRYQTFCTMYPGLADRLSYAQIAACLNVSPSALSRALGEASQE